MTLQNFKDVIAALDAQIARCADHSELSDADQKAIADAIVASTAKLKACYDSHEVPDKTSPAAPVGLAATINGATEIDLNWSLPVGEIVAGYQLERADGAGNNVFVPLTSTSAVSFADKGLKASTTFQYRVRSVDAAGNQSLYSNTASAVTPA